jgi:hypothetical protein
MLVTEVPAGMPSPRVSDGRAEVTVVVCPLLPVVTVVNTVACALLCARVNTVEVPLVILAGGAPGEELVVGPPTVCTTVVVIYVF